MIENTKINQMPSVSASSLAPVKGRLETRQQWYFCCFLILLALLISQLFSKKFYPKVVITSYMSLFKFTLIKYKKFTSSDQKPYLKCLVATCGQRLPYQTAERENIFIITESSMGQNCSIEYVADKLKSNKEFSRVHYSPILASLLKKT